MLDDQFDGLRDARGQRCRDAEIQRCRDAEMQDMQVMHLMLGSSAGPRGIDGLSYF